MKSAACRLSLAACRRWTKRWGRRVRSPRGRSVRESPPCRWGPRTESVGRTENAAWIEEFPHFLPPTLQYAVVQCCMTTEAKSPSKSPVRPRKKPKANCIGLGGVGGGGVAVFSKYFVGSGRPMHLYNVHREQEMHEEALAKIKHRRRATATTLMLGSCVPVKDEGPTISAREDDKAAALGFSLWAVAPPSNLRRRAQRALDIDKANSLFALRLATVPSVVPPAAALMASADERRFEACKKSTDTARREAVAASQLPVGEAPQTHRAWCHREAGWNARHHATSLSFFLAERAKADETRAHIAALYDRLEAAEVVAQTDRPRLDKSNTATAAQWVPIHADQSPKGATDQSSGGTAAAAQPPPTLINSSLPAHADGGAPSLTQRDLFALPPIRNVDMRPPMRVNFAGARSHAPVDLAIFPPLNRTILSLAGPSAHHMDSALSAANDRC